MKSFFQYLLVYLIRAALWLRYKVTVKGLDKLTPEVLNKSGGVLFLPNHPAVFVDPTLVTVSTFPRFTIRPIIVEYMYYLPVINQMMKFVNAIPMPDFDRSSNSLKRKKSEKVIESMIQGLKQGDNFLIYPAGKTKSTSLESIGGASAVQRLINEVPEANVVLVRVKGLWGSSFSRAFTGKSPPFFPTLFRGIKTVLQNLIFFTPRRKVEVEFFPAPADFPYHGSRMEINRYLEVWYNQPDGFTQQKGAAPGDSLILVPYHFWDRKIPELPTTFKEEAKVNLRAIPQSIQTKVIGKIAGMVHKPPEAIQPEMNISIDLGLDSLDTAELLVFLQEDFEVEGVTVLDLTTVASVMGYASKQLVPEEEKHKEENNGAPKWLAPTGSGRVKVAPGETIPEAFLRNCDRMKGAIACGDLRSGILTYPQLKLRVLLLAEWIRTLPGQYIGIFLPASVGASIMILATQLAGKIPLMVNWTVGSRHLDSVANLSKVEAVITSWAFVDRLERVELGPIEDKLIMLEDIKGKFNWKAKLKALWRSKLSTEAILKIFDADKLTSNNIAVLLFTSGTESLPKGVPLTHRNILSNIKSSLTAIDIVASDVLFGILPPFHAFGFTISALLGLVSGLRVAYSPDPNDGKALARGLKQWGITLLCGAPTFVKGALRVARMDQVQSMRLCLTGAERTPQDLFDLVKQMGKEGCIIEGYGITECSPVITANRINEPTKGVGRPLDDVEICIIHPETNEPLPLNTQGLILAHGPNVFSGYLNPGLASPFIKINGKQWYKTGDLGMIDEKGNLTISGRLKRFIKIGAEMVSLGAIEEAAYQIGLRKKAINPEEGPPVAICAKEIAGEKPKITLFAKFETTVDEVNQMLKELGFGNLVRISTVFCLEDIPISGTGKVNYRQLESQYLT